MSTIAFLRGQEAASPPWDPRTPSALYEALLQAAQADPLAAEALLSPFTETHETAPELWWGLGLAQCGQDDETNAQLCLDNFRTELDRALDAALAVARSGESRLAFDILGRLEPSLARAGDYLKTASACVGLAGAALGCGEMESARAAVGQSYRAFRTQSPRPWPLLAEALGASGVLAHERGDFRRAARRVGRAVAWAQHEPQLPFRIARLRRDLGVIWSELRQDAAAEHELRAALSIADSIGDRQTAAAIRTDLAEHLVERRDFVAALDLFRAVEQVPALPAHLRAEALRSAAACQIHLGRALEDPRHFHDAARMLGEAIALRLAGRPWFVADGEYLLLSHLQLLRGDPAGARALLVLALRAARRAGRRDGPTMVRAETLVVGLRLADGRLASAARWADKALARRLRLIDAASPVVLDALMICASVAYRRGEVSTARRHLETVLRREAAALARLFDLDAGPADWVRLRLGNEASEALASLDYHALASDDGASERLLTILLGRRGLGRALRNVARLGRSLTSDTSLAAIRNRLPAGAVVAGVLTLRPSLAIDPDRAWVSAFGPARALAFAFGPDRTTVLEDLGPLSDLRPLASRWRARVQAGRSQIDDPFLQRLGPLTHPIANAARTYWVGDDLFEALPLAAWLGADREIASVTSLHPTSGASSPTQTRLLAAVSGDFMEAGALKAHVDREVQAAARGATEPLVLKDPTPAHLMAHLRAVPFSRLHLVAHGEALSDDRGADPYDNAGLAWRDGSLTAAEAARLDLRHCELAVLSSCLTGRGGPQFAEGAASLAAGFLDAGAQAALGSLWPTPDVPTADFMAFFYAQPDADPVRQLARARARAQASGQPAASWAAWCLVTSLPAKRP